MHFYAHGASAICRNKPGNNLFVLMIIRLIIILLLGIKPTVINELKILVNEKSAELTTVFNEGTTRELTYMYNTELEYEYMASVESDVIASVDLDRISVEVPGFYDLIQQSFIRSRGVIKELNEYLGKEYSYKVKKYQLRIKYKLKSVYNIPLFETVNDIVPNKRDIKLNVVNEVKLARLNKNDRLMLKKKYGLQMSLLNTPLNNKRSIVSKGSNILLIPHFIYSIIIILN